MATMLIRASEKAPIAKSTSSRANKILAEHSGGTKAVAIAIPLISNRRKQWLATV